MTSVGRTVAVVSLLAAVTAAAPFVKGTRFGTVGLDWGNTSDFKSALYHDAAAIATFDPYFRTDIAVRADLAVGAELALLNTLPHRDEYGSAPIVSFGPSATYHLFPDADAIRPYVTAGAGANYGFVGHNLGWRVRLGAGAMWVTASSLAFGLEAGWYSDWYRWIQWDRGDTGFLGIRVMGFK